MTTDLIRLNSSFFNLEPFDICFRDLFDSKSAFDSILENRCNISYPVDIKETQQGLEIDIAAVGCDKGDIQLEIQDSNVLKVEYAKEKEEKVDTENYIRRGITRRAFKFAWKIAPKFNLEAMTADMRNGLLKLKIPVSPESKPKKVEIK